MQHDLDLRFCFFALAGAVQAGGNDFRVVEDQYIARL
jgi:hypothetical protein